MRLSIVCAVLLAACSGSSTDSSLITYARVVGVRIETVGDPERATPRIDEAATARVLISDPHGAVDVTYAILLCPAAPTNGTLPTCDGPPLASIANVAPSTAPEFSWSDLDPSAVGDRSELLILGTVCETGTPVLDPSAPGMCQNPESAGVSFSSHVTLLDEGESNLNRHPSLDAAVLTIDDQVWDASECPVTFSRDGAAHDIRITLVDARREQVDGVNEEFLLSWFTTEGELGQHYSVLEIDDEDDRPLDLTWTAPKADSAQLESTTTITLVLRDQRGGIDWLTRTVCWM